MNELLDYEEINSNVNRKYAIKSFKALFYGLAVTLLKVWLLLHNTKTQIITYVDNIGFYPLLISCVTLVIISIHLLGLKWAMDSFMQKEPLNFYGRIGLIGNLFFVLFYTINNLT